MPYKIQGIGYYHLSQSYKNYRTIENSYKIRASAAHSKFLNYYDENFHNIEQVVDEAYNVAERLFEEVAEEAVEDLRRNGIYDISKDMYISKYIKSVGIEPWDKIYSTAEEEYNKILEQNNAEREYRAARKAGRSRFSGGGFGIDGAIQGSINAGMLNMGTGLAHSAVNVLGNIGSAVSASIKKNDLFKECKDLMAQAIYDCVYCFMFSQIDALKEMKGTEFSTPTRDDCKRADALMDNVNAGNIPEDKLPETLQQVLNLNPLNESLMEYVLINAGDNSWEYEHLCNDLYFDMRSVKLRLIKKEYDAELSKIKEMPTEEKEAPLKELHDKCGEKALLFGVSLEDFKDLTAEADEMLKDVIKELRTIEWVTYESKEEYEKVKHDIELYNEYISQHGVNSTKDEILGLDFQCDIITSNLDERFDRDVTKMFDPNECRNNVIRIFSENYYGEQGEMLPDNVLVEGTDDFQKVYENMFEMQGFDKDEIPAFIYSKWQGANKRKWVALTSKGLHYIYGYENDTALYDIDGHICSLTDIEKITYLNDSSKHFTIVKKGGGATSIEIEVELDSTDIDTERFNICIDKILFMLKGQRQGISEAYQKLSPTVIERGNKHKEDAVAKKLLDIDYSDKALFEEGVKAFSDWTGSLLIDFNVYTDAFDKIRTLHSGYADGIAYESENAAKENEQHIKNIIQKIGQTSGNNVDDIHSLIEELEISDILSKDKYIAYLNAELEGENERFSIVKDVTYNDRRTAEQARKDALMMDEILYNREGSLEDTVEAIPTPNEEKLREFTSKEDIEEVLSKAIEMQTADLKELYTSYLNVCLNIWNEQADTEHFSVNNFSTRKPFAERFYSERVKMEKGKQVNVTNQSFCQWYDDIYKQYTIVKGSEYSPKDADEAYYTMINRARLYLQYITEKNTKKSFFSKLKTGITGLRYNGYEPDYNAATHEGTKPIPEDDTQTDYVFTTELASTCEASIEEFRNYIADSFPRVFVPEKLQDKEMNADNLFSNEVSIDKNVLYDILHGVCSSSLLEKIQDISQSNLLDCVKKLCDEHKAKFGEANYKVTPKLVNGLSLSQCKEIYLGHDDTLLKSGKNGFAVTDMGIYCRDKMEKNATVFSYGYLAGVTDISWNESDASLLINNRSIICFTDDSSGLQKEALKSLVEEICRLSRLAKRGQSGQEETLEPEMAVQQEINPASPVVPVQDASLDTDSKPKTDFCPNCGTKIIGVAKFCSNCGNPLA